MKKILVLLFTMGLMFATYLSPLYFESETGCWVYADEENPSCMESEEREGYWEYEFNIPNTAEGLKKTGMDFGKTWVRSCLCGMSVEDCRRSSYPSDEHVELNLNDYHDFWKVSPDTVLDYNGKNIFKPAKTWHNTFGTYLTNGLLLLKICLYYPLLEIDVTSTNPSGVKAEDEVVVEGVVSNIGDVDAQNVKVVMQTDDFRVEPSEFTFDLLNQDETASKSEKKFMFTITPKTGSGRDVNYELNGINMGTIVASYTFDGTKKEFEYELGTVPYITEGEEEAEGVVVGDTAEDGTSAVTDEGGMCAMGFVIPVVLLFVLSRR